MILLSMDKTREFLETEMKARGWKQADLARASKLDSAVISNIINGRRKMGEETGRAIADAFGLPPEIVFRAGGLLPDVPEEVAREEELDYLLSQLTPEDLQEVIDYARLRLQKKREKQDYKKKLSRSIRPARSALKGK